MPDSQIALQLYTIRDALSRPQDTIAALKRVAAVGYQAVEICGYGGLELTEFSRLLGDLGLVACSSHNGFDELRDNPEAVAEELVALGCHQVVSGPTARYTSEQEWLDFAHAAGPVAARLQELGLVYAYHHHSFEFEKFGARTALEILYEESDPSVVNFQIDTYWVQHGGGSPVTWINKVGCRAPTLHMKDMAMRGSEQLYAEVGEGNLDWAGIIAAGKQNGVRWYIVEQDFCQRDPFESIALSFNHMKEMGLE